MSIEQENELGEPTYGAGKSKKDFSNANWKISTEGSHYFRILPPFGSLSKSGRYMQYEALHWGMEASNGWKRVFPCVRVKDNKTKMVKQECPMCLRIDAKREELAKKIEQLKKAKVDFKAPEAKKMLQPLNDWLQRFNVQRGFFLNAMSPDGKIGRLYIKIKCKNDLEIAISKLVKDGYNPVGIEGVWLDFQRFGLGRDDTTFKVEPVQETVDMNGVKAKVVKTHKLTPDLIAQVKASSFDLGTFYTQLDYNSVQALATSGENNSEIVDSIFGVPKTSASEVTEEEDEVPVRAAEPEEDIVSATSKMVNTDANMDDFLAAFNAGKV